MLPHGRRHPRGGKPCRTRITEVMGVFPLISEGFVGGPNPALSRGSSALTPQTLQATFRWANRIRARYTVLDFLEGQDRLDAAIDGTFSPGATDF